MTYVLVALNVILGLGLLLLVLMHSGMGGGMSSAFGGASTFGGSGVAQKNLTRLTIVCAVAFFMVSIALGYLW